MSVTAKVKELLVHHEYRVRQPENMPSRGISSWQEYPENHEYRQPHTDPDYWDDVDERLREW
jgi:hypothetical protein